MISFDFGQTGLTNIVAVRFDTGGDVWNTDTSAFEAYNAGNIADYAIATTEVGNSGIYEFSDPASVNGRAVVCLQTGVSFAETDLLAKLATLSIQYSTVADSVTNPVTVGTNNDKTGYSLTQSFPTNFAAMGINSSGHIERVTLVDTTTSNTDMRGTDAALLAANYVAPANSDITAIKAKTDNLPESPAAVSDIPTASQNATQVRTELATELARIDAAISSRSTFVPGTDAVFLTSDYDAAKTAAQQGDKMDLIDAPNATAVAAIQSGLSTFDAGSDQVIVVTNNDKMGYGLANDAIKAVTIEDGAFAGAKFASGAFDAVWSVGTRTLTSFGTLVTDITSAIWAAAQRTLTAFDFNPTPSNAADTTAIKAKTDQLVFTQAGLVDASAEFSLTEQNIQDIADGVVEGIEEQGVDISDQSLIEITNAVAAVRANVSKTPNRGGLLRLYIGDTYAQAIGTQITWILDDAEGLVDLTGYMPLLSITVRGVTINSSNGVVSVATGNQRSGYVELFPSDYGDIQPGDGEYSIAFVGPGTPEVVTTQIDGLVIMRATPESEGE